MKYRCPVCGYIYDEEKQGVKFEDLPDVRCPAGITSRTASTPSSSSSPAGIPPICPTESR